MVRHRARTKAHKKKLKKKKKRKKININVWEKVLERCTEGEDPWKVALDTPNIKYTTLKYRLDKLKTNPTHKFSYQETILSPQQEESFLFWVTQRGKMADGITRAQCDNKLKRLAESSGKYFCSKSGFPSHGWWDRFFLRHPTARSAIPATLDKTHAKGANPQQTNLFFDSLETVLQKFPYLCNKPHLWWGFDETSIVQNGKKVEF